MAQRTQSVAGGGLETQHYYSETEKKGLVDFLNQAVPDAHVNPEGDELFQRLRDGVLFYKLIDAIEPGLIKKEAITTKFSDTKKKFQMLENARVVLEAAVKMKCQIVNVGPDDILAGTPHLVLGVLWQVVRVGLLKKVSELSKTSLPPEEMLLKWFNFHLKKQGSNRTVTNFGPDLMDSECLTLLLHSVTKGQCDKSPLNEKDLNKRAELMLQQADKVGCRKFVSSNDIVKGNARLNLAFVATIFAKFPEMIDDTPREPAEDKDKIIADLKHQVDALTNEINQLRARESDLLAEIERLRKENQQLKEKIARLQSELEALRNEQAAKSSDAAAWKQREQELLERITQLEGQLKEEEKEKLALQEKLREQETSLKQEFEETEKRMQESFEEKEQMWKKKLEALEKAGGDVEALRREMDARDEEWQKKLKEKENELEELRKSTAGEIKKLKEKNKEMEAELEKARATEKKLRALVAQPEEREGFLTKKAQNGKMLKRWCILRGEYLLFYRKKNPENQAKTAGAIFLPNSVIKNLSEEESIKETGSKKLKSAFTIESKYANRIYVLAANDNEDRDNWIKAIEAMKNWFAAREEFLGQRSDGNQQANLVPSDDESTSEKK